MSFELRMIEDELFVVRHVGRKEKVLTPAEAIAEQQDLAAEAEAELAANAAVEANLAAQLDAAILAGESTADLRTELDALRETISGLRQNIANAQAAARQVVALIDGREADAIRQADQNRLSAVTAPFDNALKEFAQ